MLTIYKHLIFIILICFNKSVFSADNNIDLQDLDNTPGLVNTKENKGPIEIIKTVPVSRNKYKNVSDGDRTIYQCSGDNEGVEKVTVTKFYDKSKVMNISVTTDDYYETKEIFLCNFISDWHLIDQEIYDIFIDTFNIERNLEIFNYQNDGTYITDEHNLHGLKGTVLIPNENYQLVGVFHKGTRIWSTNDLLVECTSVIVHGDLQLTKLINVNVKHQNDDEPSSDDEDQKQPDQSESEKVQEPEQKQPEQQKESPDLPKLFEKLELMKNEKLKDLKEKLKEELKALLPGDDLCFMFQPTCLRSIFEGDHEEQKSQEATSCASKTTELESQLFYEDINGKWTKVSKKRFYARLNELDTEMLSQSKEEEATE